MSGVHRSAFPPAGLGNLVKNGLGFEHAVEIAHAGMVAADDHAGAPIVLAEGGMKKGFTGACIAHIQRIPALKNLVFHKVILNQGRQYI